MRAVTRPEDGAPVSTTVESPEIWRLVPWSQPPDNLGPAELYRRCLRHVAIALEHALDHDEERTGAASDLCPPPLVTSAVDMVERMTGFSGSGRRPRLAAHLTAALEAPFSTAETALVEAVVQHAQVAGVRDLDADDLVTIFERATRRLLSEVVARKVTGYGTTLEEMRDPKYARQPTPMEVPGRFDQPGLDLPEDAGEPHADLLLTEVGAALADVLSPATGHLYRFGTGRALRPEKRVPLLNAVYLLSRMLRGDLPAAAASIEATLSRAADGRRARSSSAGALAGADDPGWREFRELLRACLAVTQGGQHTDNLLSQWVVRIHRLLEEFWQQFLRAAKEE
jgi:hypothetical protein